MLNPGGIDGPVPSLGPFILLEPAPTEAANASTDGSGTEMASETSRKRHPILIVSIFFSGFNSLSSRAGFEGCVKQKIAVPADPQYQTPPSNHD